MNVFFMEENPDQIRHNADKLYLNVKKMMVYMMEATKEMCTRIDHMENLQGRSFADDILPGYQSEEELEALEEQRQKEQRKSFWSSLFERKVALHLQKSYNGREACQRLN